MIGDVGMPELIIIVIIVAVVFGAGRISGLGRELGASIREFRRAVSDESPDEGPEPAPGAAETAGQQTIETSTTAHPVDASHGSQPRIF